MSLNVSRISLKSSFAFTGRKGCEVILSATPQFIKKEMQQARKSTRAEKGAGRHSSEDVSVGEMNRQISQSLCNSFPLTSEFVVSTCTNTLLHLLHASIFPPSSPAPLPPPPPFPPHLPRKNPVWKPCINFGLLPLFTAVCYVPL